MADESIKYRVGARRETGGRLNAEQFPNIWAVEVIHDDVGLLVTEIAFARLRLWGHFEDPWLSWTVSFTLDTSYTFRPIRRA